MDRYLDGTIDKIDIELLKDLEDSAIPAMAKLYEALDEMDDLSEVDQKNFKTLEHVLTERARIRENNPNPFWSYNLPYFKAKSVLEDYY